MNEHEKALPAGGPAKPTQNAVKIYVISSRERLLLPLAFCFCLLLVNTLLWSGPTAGLTASVCVWYGLLGLYLGRTLLNTWESRVLLAVNLALAATLALGSNWYFRAWNLLALLALLILLALLGLLVLLQLIVGLGFGIFLVEGDGQLLLLLLPDDGQRGLVPGLIVAGQGGGEGGGGVDGGVVVRQVHGRGRACERGPRQAGRFPGNPGLVPQGKAQKGSG